MVPGGLGFFIHLHVSCKENPEQCPAQPLPQESCECHLLGTRHCSGKNRSYQLRCINFPSFRFRLLKLGNDTTHLSAAAFSCTFLLGLSPRHSRLWVPRASRGRSPLSTARTRASFFLPSVSFPFLFPSLLVHVLSFPSGTDLLWQILLLHFGKKTQPFNN